MYPASDYHEISILLRPNPSAWSEDAPALSVLPASTGSKVTFYLYKGIHALVDNAVRQRMYIANCDERVIAIVGQDVIRECSEQLPESVSLEKFSLKMMSMATPTILVGWARGITVLPVSLLFSNSEEVEREASVKTTLSDPNEWVACPLVPPDRIMAIHTTEEQKRLWKEKRICPMCGERHEKVRDL